MNVSESLLNDSQTLSQRPSLQSKAHQVEVTEALHYCTEKPTD